MATTGDHEDAAAQSSHRAFATERHRALAERFVAELSRI